MSSSPIVILPASSRSGLQAAKVLLQQNVHVRAAARDVSKLKELKSLGAEVVEADLEKPDTVKAALQGAKALFFVNPPGYSGHDVGAQAEKNAKVLVEALENSTIKRVVYLSSVGAELSDRVGFIKAIHIVEEALKSLSSKIEFVALRAAYFVENWSLVAPLAFSAPHILPSLNLPIDRPMAQVGTTDAGTTAAKYLTISSSVLSSTGPTYVELSGPKDLSAIDIAKAFENINGGNPVNTIPIEDKDFEATVEKSLPKVAAANVAEMARAINAGRVDWLKDGFGFVIKERGVTPVEVTLRELV